MLEWLTSIFGDPNKRQLKKLWPIVDEINEWAEEFEELSDDDLSAKTEEFRQEIKDSTIEIDQRINEIYDELQSAMQGPISMNGQEGGQELSLEEREYLYEEIDDLEDERREVLEAVLEDILPEAFAVIKETCRRMLGETWEAGGSTIEWGMVPYDVQLLGGIALHRGMVAEMKTGEGKTLVAVLPVYLNALVGEGVHVVTVNPYLAERDAEWMEPIFGFHGLTVDCVDRYKPHSKERREAYRADITYGTNNEFGFDYLRDNSFVVKPEQLVQREHHFAIIDEVDSVLIDEARTPLIISGPVPEPQKDQYTELRNPIEKVVRKQRKIVRDLVNDARDMLEERDEALEEGDKRRANDLEEEAGLALLRAHRGYQKDEELQELLSEKGVERLRQKTEFFYLQENAKRMPFVDEVLLFALDEKQHSIEMTEKGQLFISNVANEAEDFFVLPVLGDEIAKIEKKYKDKKQQLREDLEAQDLTEEKRRNKLMNDERLLQKEMEEEKRELYNTYSERAERLHAVEQLLKAYTLYEKDTEYIVQDGKVQIVDIHTGRVLSGRRYSDGLHQAIEAKEQVEVQKPTQTYATVTLQNYFRMYDKLAGMTGTAETEAEEFDEIYEMDVIVVPTNEPVARDDKDDLVFKTKNAKYNAIVERIDDYNEKGQPVLVGTTSVDVSEVLSKRLQREGIQHNVLNAKAERAKTEAQIVAEAGQKGSVTIATNMAGRGTDIKLGKGVREVGGLAVVGSERHESRRIDLQLRGRAGRQGDPGESQFFVSLEDDLMRLFGQDRVAKVMDKLNLEEDAVITHPWINKSIERAQSKVEQNHFAVRKRQLEFDDVLNSQREVIYDRRQYALKGERFHNEILSMLRENCERIVERHYGEGNIEEMREELLRTLAFDYEIEREEFVRLGEDGVAREVFKKAVEYYRRKREALAEPFYKRLKEVQESDSEQKPERVFVDFTDGNRMLRAVCDVEDALNTNGQEINDALERVAMLSIIDQLWMEHLRQLDEVKEGIGLRSFGRKDPVVEYKMEAYDLFVDMMERMSNEVVSLVVKAGPLVDDKKKSRRAPQSRIDASRAQERHDSAEPSYGVDANGSRNEAAERDPTADQEPVVVGEKVGRNDPCPCGSGKKYKHCCGG